ncbi:MAG: DUF4197 domain-containing protein [Chloroflexi bacterium]|nr:DUF4197 domain-containing protein [Chloroflexota bacterium]
MDPLVWCVHPARPPRCTMDRGGCATRIIGRGDASKVPNAVRRRCMSHTLHPVATINDAKSILTGPDDSATRYFRGKTSGALTSAFLPIVKSTTDSAGVTSAFKKLVSKAGPAAEQLGGSADVDKYITEKTLDGLFLKLAAEEKSIRQNPAARSTDLLKKVFGGK